MLSLKIVQSAAARGCVLSHVTSTRTMSLSSQFYCQQRRLLTSGQKLRATASRLFSRQIPRLPLDAEKLSAMITEDVTVFTYRKNRFFLLLTIFGGIQFLCWANFAVFIKSDPMANSMKLKKDDSWMGKFFTHNRTKLAAACLGLGFVVLFFTLSYPLRTVAQLTLLKGGRNLGVTTYWHFGRTRYFTVPLDDVSCRRSRTASPAYAAMKIRGHWMYFLLDTLDGRFHEPELYDYVIGLNRSLK